MSFRTKEFLVPSPLESGRLKIEYRPAENSDAPALVTIRAAFWADQISRGSLDYPDLEPNKFLTDTHFLINRARTTIILAAEGIKVIAYAVGQTKILPGQGTMVSSIEEVYVDPHYRRSAVAQQLVMMMMVQFKNLGAKRVQLRVLDRNESAKAFWQEVGFSPSVVIYEYLA